MLAFIKAALPTTGQALGIVAALTGFLMLTGLAWVLLIGGLCALLWGTVAEMSEPAAPERQE